MTGSESKPRSFGRLLAAGVGTVAVVVVALGVLTPSGAAVAQESGAAEGDSSESEGRVLHEYVDPTTLRFASEPSPSPSPGGAAPAGGKPQQTGRQAGQPPELTLTAGQGDTIRGPEGPVEQSRARSPYGPAAPQGGSTRLDDQTDQVDDLQYYSAFDPSVFPYKRNVAQNRVVYRGGQYQMAVREGQVSRQQVGGEARADEDTFWGSFLLRAEAGELHPIPSVAPDQRLLEMYAEPDVAIRVYKDAADNWYLRVPHDGLLRVNAKIAAPRFYFEGEFDGGLDWGAFSSASSLGLEGRVRAVARQVLDDIGISRDVPPARALNLMVFHFRNFETRSLESAEKEGDLYRTIATEQVGVCRHRSLAFVITARALGVPARYVFNEAHAFVEVWWPRGGWRRIDLGGAAQDIGYNGGSGDRLHDGGADRLPRPPRFRRELERLREDEENKKTEQGEQQSSESRPSGESGQSEGAGREESAGRDGAAGNERGDGPGNTQGDDGANSRPDGTEETPGSESTAPPPNASELAEALMEGRQRAASQAEAGGDSASGGGQPTRLVLRADRSAVRRGDGILLYGVLTTEGGQPVGGRDIQVYLGRVGERETRDMLRLTRVQTDDSGQFRTRVSIPKATSIGRWSIVALFAGDASYQPARAR